MKKLVVLTGAGISAESGIRTFRDAGGLWEDHDVMEVCSAQGWECNPQLVLDFYTSRRRQLLDVVPNKAHFGLVELAKYFDVQIITQNVDNLHEQAGSTNVLHLHGELMKVRSIGDPSLIYQLDTSNLEVNVGDKCEMGYQLRPHIVFFGEAVPAMDEAITICQKADLFVVIGTSLNVYPAAGLLNYIPSGIPTFLIDPNPATVDNNIQVFAEKASVGIDLLKSKLISYV